MFDEEFNLTYMYIGGYAKYWEYNEMSNIFLAGIFRQKQRFDATGHFECSEEQ